MSTTVARLLYDETTARRLASALAEIFDGEDIVCAAFEDDSGQWQVAIHFRDQPDESALRAQVALVAGDKAAAAVALEPVAAADWVAQSLSGLKPVQAGRFVVHGAHDRARVKPNDIGIEIEAALAFGTGHHGTTRGCLLALERKALRAVDRYRRIGVARQQAGQHDARVSGCQTAQRPRKTHQRTEKNIGKDQVVRRARSNGAGLGAGRARKGDRARAIEPRIAARGLDRDAVDVAG